MIFYGTKSKVKSGGLIEGIECPNCENKQFHSFGVIRFFHIYNIPTLPTSKVAGIECTHCKKTLTGKELPKELAARIKASVFTKKDTLPLFAGVFILALFVSWFSYSLYESAKQEAIYIEQPAVNDLYVADFSKIFEETEPGYRYGMLRINQISGDQIELQISNTVFNKSKGVYKDIRNNNWSSETYFAEQTMIVPHGELKSWKESGTIFSIKRP